MPLESREISKFQKCLIRGAEEYLGVSPNIVAAIQKIKQDPGLFNLRASEFDVTCQALNEELTMGSGFGDGYLNVVRLWHELDKSPFPTPSQLFHPGNRPLLRIADQTFMEIQGKISTGEWQFPTQISDQNRLTTGLLIEGYGLFLEKLYDIPDLSRVFVLSIEEICWNKYRESSSLLRDALPWMIEERGEFSYQMGKELEELTPEYILQSKKRSILASAPFLNVFINKRLMGSGFAKGAIKEVVRPLHQDLEDKLGKKWEVATLSAPLSLIDSLKLLSPEIDFSVQAGTVEALFLIGYEVGNMDKISLFSKEIFGGIGDLINKNAIETYEGVHVIATVIASTMNAGVKLKNAVDPTSIVDFDPGVDSQIVSQQLPKALRDYLQELGFK